MHGGKSGLAAEDLVARSNPQRSSTKRARFQSCVNLHRDCHSACVQRVTLGYSRACITTNPTK
ncbi:hypothetical protein N7530_008554 [Penicillium desertorum]|uniref:Uncharacterized protein n=1 Tax=Penicillium desertorum TaxID=1303715 RepID=A0A9W9WQ44_9EURO|nr:hypothetical protein N7530_008554 [Penicillium desertorum]